MKWRKCMKFFCRAKMVQNAYSHLMAHLWMCIITKLIHVYICIFNGLCAQNMQCYLFYFIFNENQFTDIFSKMFIYRNSVEKEHTNLKWKKKRELYTEYIIYIYIFALFMYVVRFILSYEHTQVWLNLGAGVCMLLSHHKSMDICTQTGRFIHSFNVSLSLLLFFLWEKYLCFKTQSLNDYANWFFSSQLLRFFQFNITLMSFL